MVTCKMFKSTSLLFAQAHPKICAMERFKFENETKIKSLKIELVLEAFQNNRLPS